MPSSPRDVSRTLITKVVRYDADGNVVEESTTTTEAVTLLMNNRRRQRLIEQIEALKAAIVKVV
jgi:hypothetical protein